ncbi:MAG TPA: uroporphyrinogen-III synthase, partial [Anaerolineae bacterium]|nr:uroporphyrinogen-III synthase [Anaerolineae bacterium]
MTPLTGKRILVTRPRTQAAELCDKLAARGAHPIVLPTIEIAPLENYTALDRAIRQLAHYQWVIFTSVNGVKAFWDRLEVIGAGFTPAQRIAAIGPATA